ncbi:MAG: antibiotic biosynthesis monooxygenase [Treponema sp.]|jgi:quinol monooxygenase YgiN|nr:antibiotic biosynthesis monooxygenase [Treponema sp.]
MIRVVAKNFIKPEKTGEAEPLFRELVAETQKEEGCIEYRLFVIPGQPGLYVYVEEWEDRAALDRHTKSAHYTRIVPQTRAMAEKPGEIMIMEEFR